MSKPKILQLYDSYKKTKIVIDPDSTIKPNTLKMYSCGPTVYNYQTIGNMRAAWLPDTITKVAKLAGWQVEWTLNITDVGHLTSDGDEGEDKIEKGAKREGKSVQEIIDFYTADYRKQTEALNLSVPQGFHNPRATEYIKEQMILALQLLAENKAYLTDDGIYFDTLANMDLDVPDHPVFEIYDHKYHTQTNSKNYSGRDILQTNKKHPDDFALWKFVSEKNLQKWKFNEVEETEDLMIRILQNLDPKDYDLPNRYGCPGWHSECVCMICGTLGAKGKPVDTKFFEQFAKLPSVIDLHTGGEDHIDIHHKNEILQAEALGFHLSKNWVHNKFVMVDGGKMSKSLGNVYLVTGRYEDTGFYSLTNPPQEIADRLQVKYQVNGFDPLAYRLMLFEHHYTEQLNFTWGKLEQSQARLWNLRKEAAKLGSVKSVDKTKTQNTSGFNRLLEILTDNLNFPKFLEEYQFLLLDATKSKDKNLINLLRLLEEEILKLNLFPEIPNQIQELTSQRIQAKQQKDFAKADQIRHQITSLGWQMDDYPWGYGIWMKDSSKF